MEERETPRTSLLKCVRLGLRVGFMGSKRELLRVGRILTLALSPSEGEREIFGRR